MGLDCVNKMTESTEVFTINAASNTDLNQPRKDVESQNSSTNRWTTHRVIAYVIDVAVLSGIIILVLLFETGIIRGHKAGFYCNDPALSFPYQGEVVTTPIIVSTLFVLPIVVIFPTELIMSEDHSTKRYTNNLKQAWLVYRMYLYGLLMNFGVVEMMKGLAGSPRPTFFDLCKPDAALTCNGTEFVSSFECTSEFSWWYQLDSYRSFPSGHASFSVYCGFFIAWYLQKRAFAWTQPSTLAVTGLQLLSITYSIICSLTRITDRRHHWWDVLAGTVVGFITLLYAVIYLADNFNLKKSEEPEQVRLEERQHSVRTLLYEDQRS
ncbi:phospholipid phosphatase 2 isoform X1 [Manduca sexta]|uniref:phospholipid phosphatase 2 isoform X1 n=1 Tax=Manduca sexta TaxID=7130 RepID=UPI001181E347|nr:phospholipid phosphatase 2 isoform X1 [Manduca sexta]